MKMVRSLSTFPAVIVLAGLLASPAAVFAGAPAASKAAADVLYEDGKRLLGEKKYEQALAKLLASQHLDPGLGTLLNIAYCYEHVGKTASAWATYNEAAGVANATDDKEGRADMATRAAKALEPKLARATITVPAENRAVGLEVRRDGELVDAATWDSSAPNDPGTHVFAASAPGRAAWKTSVEVPMGPDDGARPRPSCRPRRPRRSRRRERRTRVGSRALQWAERGWSQSAREPCSGG